VFIFGRDINEKKTGAPTTYKHSECKPPEPVQGTLPGTDCKV